MHQAKSEFETMELRRLSQNSQQPTNKLKARYTLLYNRWHSVNEQLCLMEEDLSITERWVPGSQDYERGMKLISERKYRAALDKLERLVVQRLFELTKLGMSGTGALTHFTALNPAEKL